jgi:outer membrane protein W
MKRLTILIIFTLLTVILPLNAQGRSYSPHHYFQSVNLKIGLFQPNMNSDLWEVNMENLALNKQDMQEIYYAIEYEFFFNPRLSLCVEAGHYEKEHFSQYTEYEYDDGSPIYQNIALSVTSIELNLKIYPIGHKRIVNPYIGGGLGINSWHYEQWGDFLNFDDLTVSEGYADTKAYTLGFNAKAGFLFRIKQNVGFSFEARYLYLQGQLSSLFEGFEKLDMSGMAYSLGINLLF